MFCRSKLSPPHGKPTIQPKNEIPCYLFSSKQRVKPHITNIWYCVEIAQLSAAMFTHSANN